MEMLTPRVAVAHGENVPSWSSPAAVPRYGTTEPWYTGGIERKRAWDSTRNSSRGRPSPAPSSLAGKSDEADVKRGFSSILPREKSARNGNGQLVASRKPPPSRHIIKPGPGPGARSNVKISVEEKRALTIVDFSEEAGKADFSVEELLSRFTNATDTEGTFLTLRDCDSDSDTSSMGSFSSSSSDGL